MTCIAVFKNKRGKLVMAGDRRVTINDDIIQSMTWPKINKKDGLLLGAAGSGDLCSFFVEDGGFDIPEKRTKNINTYMYYTFRPAIVKALATQGYINKITEHEITLADGGEFYLLIGIEAQLWQLALAHLRPDVLSGRIILERVSNIPYAIGSGGLSALTLMKYELSMNNYLTKEHIKSIFRVISEINPSCDSNCDIIVED